MRGTVAILLSGLCFAAVASIEAAQRQRAGREAGTAGPRASAEAAFFARDLDGDGRLSLDEFTFPAEGQPRFEDAKRNFHIYDSDEDGFLTFEEFSQTPGATPRGPPGNVADPILRELEAAVARAAEALSKHDSDGDGRFSRDEFEAARLHETLSGQFPQAFSALDRDADGYLTLDEIRFALELSWGARRPTGDPLRTDTGLVYRERNFHTRDADGDGMLTLDEFPGPNQDLETAARQFEQADRDGDGRLTFAEFCQTSAGRMNVVQAFKRFDENGDGRLDRDEFLAGVPRWEFELAERSFTVFDADGDGLLSFQEFRATPFANPIGNAMHRLRDRDNDGRLSLQEFREQWNPDAPDLAAWYFARFDANGDGWLDLDEFPFAVNVSAVPRDVAFRAKDTDGDGRLSLAEFFGRQPPRDAAALARYEQQLARFEDNFLAADRDGDGFLSLEEFRTARLTPRADPADADELADDAEFGNETASPGTAGPGYDPPTGDGLEWWLIAVLVVDALVVVWLVWLFVNWRRSRRHAGTSEPFPPA